MEPEKHDLPLLMVDFIEELLIENSILRGAVKEHGLTAIQSLIEIALKPDSEWRVREKERLASLRARLQENRQDSDVIASLVRALPRNRGVN
jgi:hypothetical protein